ncbi:DUF4926 domain-containing protein [Sphingomonas sp.]|uniref:DUF4926 domain-containing protein n=1 Tax=Sphingomonas sp. TaxID=28214 RepID=UPI003D6CAF13
MHPNTLDTIKVLKPIPEEGIEAGANGVIIAIFENPDEAYEVEFSDDEGRPVAQVVLQREDFDLA